MRDDEFLDQLLADIRSARSRIAASNLRRPLDEVDTLLSVAESDLTRLANQAHRRAAKQRAAG